MGPCRNSIVYALYITLWSIILALLAAERKSQKIKIFNKIGKNMKFEIFMSYIPQTKAKNMYNTDSKRESMIHCNKINIFEIFDFFSKGGSFDVKTLKIMFLIFQKF